MTSTLVKYPFVSNASNILLFPNSLVLIVLFSIRSYDALLKRLTQVQHSSLASKGYQLPYKITVAIVFFIMSGTTKREKLFDPLD